MISINRTPPAQMREAHSRARPIVEAVEFINLDNALQLNRPIPLMWDGQEYQVKVLSHREGLQLQRASLMIERMSAAPVTDPEELEEYEAELIQTLALFHSLLTPRPENNPFVDATPQEVGALLGFFFACQTMQSGRSSSRLVVNPRTIH